MEECFPFFICSEWEGKVTIVQVLRYITPFPYIRAVTDYKTNAIRNVVVEFGAVSGTFRGAVFRLFFCSSLFRPLIQVTSSPLKTLLSVTVFLFFHPMCLMKVQGLSLPVQRCTVGQPSCCFYL